MAEGERRWKDNDDTFRQDGSSSSGRKMMSVIPFFLPRRLQHQWQLQSRWRPHRHLSMVLLLCSCSLSYLIATSLLDIFVSDYDDENNSNNVHSNHGYRNEGGYYHYYGNDHRRTMMEKTTPIISSSSFQSLELMTVALLSHHEVHHRKRLELFERRLKGVGGENEGDTAYLLQLRQEEQYTRHFESNNRRISRAYDFQNDSER